MHIDWWTLTLQTVNVLVLIWLLARFFFRPVADIVAKRQAETNKLLAEAEAARKEATDRRAQAEKERAHITSERDRLLAEARKTAEAEKNSLLAQSADEIAKQRSEVEAALGRERAAAEGAVITHASDLSVEIARRLLQRFRADLFPAFLDNLCGELRSLTPEGKIDLTKVDAEHPLEVVTATPLADTEVENVRNALCKVFGTNVPFAFRSDPALIAGIELHSRNTVLRSSWQADLAKIHEDLNRDDALHQA